MALPPWHRRHPRSGHSIIMKSPHNMRSPKPMPSLRALEAPPMKSQQSLKRPKPCNGRNARGQMKPSQPMRPPKPMQSLRAMASGQPVTSPNLMVSPKTCNRPCLHGVARANPPKADHEVVAPAAGRHGQRHLPCAFPKGEHHQRHAQRPQPRQHLLGRRRHLRGVGRGSPRRQTRPSAAAALGRGFHHLRLGLGGARCGLAHTLRGTPRRGVPGPKGRAEGSGDTERGPSPLSLAPTPDRRRMGPGTIPDRSRIDAWSTPARHRMDHRTTAERPQNDPGSTLDPHELRRPHALDTLWGAIAAVVVGGHGMSQEPMRSPGIVGSPQSMGSLQPAGSQRHMSLPRRPCRLGLWSPRNSFGREPWLAEAHKSTGTLCAAAGVGVARTHEAAASQEPTGWPESMRSPQPMTSSVMQSPVPVWPLEPRMSPHSMLSMGSPELARSRQVAGADGVAGVRGVAALHVVAAPP